MVVVWWFMAGLTCICLVWIEIWMRKHKEPQNRIWVPLKAYGIYTCGVYGSSYDHQNLMKLFLDETRHLRIYNHIKYKAIGLVLSEIWFFEVNPRILSLILSRLDFKGYNSPYTPSNWVKPIFFMNLRHRKTSHKNFKIKFDPYCS